MIHLTVYRAQMVTQGDYSFLTSDPCRFRAAWTWAASVLVAAQIILICVHRQL